MLTNSTIINKLLYFMCEKSKNLMILSCNWVLLHVHYHTAACICRDIWYLTFLETLASLLTVEWAGIKSISTACFHILISRVAPGVKSLWMSLSPCCCWHNRSIAAHLPLLLLDMLYLLINSLVTPVYMPVLMDICLFWSCLPPLCHTQLTLL